MTALLLCHPFSGYDTYVILTAQQKLPVPSPCEGAILSFPMEGISHKDERSHPQGKSAGIIEGVRAVMFNGSEEW